MNTRLLLLPVAVAAIAVLDGCQGITPTDPSIRLCHDDTLQVTSRWSDGRTSQTLVVVRDDPSRCRKAA